MHSTGPEDINNVTRGKVEILYVEWPCAIASTYVTKAVLEELGYSVTAYAHSLSDMWNNLSKGEGDFTTSAWLPSTHEEHLRKAGVDPDDP